MAATETTSPQMGRKPLWRAHQMGRKHECGTREGIAQETSASKLKLLRGKKPTSGGYKLSFLKSQKLTRIHQDATNKEHIGNNPNGSEEATYSRWSRAKLGHEPPPPPLPQVSHLPLQCDIMRLEPADNMIRCSRVSALSPHTSNDQQQEVRTPRRKKLHRPTSESVVATGQEIVATRIEKTPPPPSNIVIEKRACNYANAIQVPTLAPAAGQLTGDDASKIRTSAIKVRCHQHWPSKQLKPVAKRAPVAITVLAACLCVVVSLARALQNDPRPTIYSGQISFGLLLSAHSSPGSDLTSAAAAAASSIDYRFASRTADADEQQASSVTTTTTTTTINGIAAEEADTASSTTRSTQTSAPASSTPPSLEATLAHLGKAPTTGQASRENQSLVFENNELLAIASEFQVTAETRHGRRQIFERPSHQTRRQQQQQQQQQVVAGKQQQQLAAPESACSQANPSALYAGMGAIWASHQANLVRDSQLAIGTYVYDSCNDLEVGQRQSVRIVSNLNAFQQTTCESPRGSPISLTIAHGDNQLRAIQLLTSFKVPVITTREPFALEDYHLLTRDQRRYLFSTAPSSRHLAVGAIKYIKRVVSRNVASPKLPNQHHRMSSKNGLIVISRNLPAKFITYLTETIPHHVNYEMLQSDQPIDQVRSVEVLESILMLSKQQSFYSSSFASGTSSPGGASAASNYAESRHSLVKLIPEFVEVMKSNKQKIQTRRSLTSDDSEAASGIAGLPTGGGTSDQDDSTSSSDQTGDGMQQSRMLSPTILMFITPSEAIDLITRLRNDLAEVSRYYSLVVATREDISPALRTIFHRGGSRLCSGKAFYTISPQPDEVHEFSRYFRDTVQMEGQSSDHPLICEFAKHQSSSRWAAPGAGDLDDIAAEAVIKAVWSAAAAFKLVHKRECGATGSGQDGSQEEKEEALGSYARGAKPHKQGRRQSFPAGNQTSGASKAPPGGGGSGSGSQSECITKISKNMSYLVQRALKKLDVTINSTGLQALDGFRIKFDESNELLTSKYSIKYINRECEITELGEYSGAKDSQLHLDEETLAKSLESTVPDSWPITAASSGKQSASATSRASGLSGGDGGLSLDSPSTSEDGATNSGQSNDSAPAAGGVSSEESPRTSGSSSDDEHDSWSRDTDRLLPSITLDRGDSPKRRRSNSGTKRKNQQPHDATKSAAAAVAATTTTTTTAPNIMVTPVSMSNGRVPIRSTMNTEYSASTTPPSTSAGPTTIATPTSTIKLATNSRPSLPALMMRVSSVAPNDSSEKPMRELKPFPGGSPGAALREWLPKSSQQEEQATATPDARQQHQHVATNETMQTSTSTTQAPVYSTLPESGGNTDLEMPAFKVSARTSAAPPKSDGRVRSSLETASSALVETSASSDYVTLPSIVRQHASGATGNMQVANATHRSSASVLLMNEQPQLSYLRDLGVSPVPLAYAGQGQLSQSTSGTPDYHEHLNHNHNHHEKQQQQQYSATGAQQSSRSRLRSHLKWIYGSWFTLTILGANICGALFTLYVLTFLLMKNCDGSLDRENQATRSMHLLAIIVVFFGSTLFIVYPTPSLCLLRTSWHNFALVLVFGSLLLQTMQTRSISSIGLGGRPNRLNQFLTLVFMVGVQVSFELQRWKYESANYINFVNQYFNSQDNGEKKLVIFSNSISGQFNPLNSFNDQVTPVSIQLSEKYQSLLHDYCTQPVEDYLQSQIYLWSIIGLLILFSITGRHHQPAGRSTNGLLITTNADTRVKGGGKSSAGPLYNLTSGKLLASQHETNEFLPYRAFSGGGPFSPAATATEHLGLASAKRGRWNYAGQLGNVFVVTLISAPIYFFSVIMYVHGQELASPDLVASVTMVLIAFIVLIGTFMPLMRNYHKYGELAGASTSSGSDQLGGGGATSNSATSLSRQIMSHNHKFADDKANRRSFGQSSENSPNGAFLMFPEFASTGLRRPSSMGGESNRGAAVRRPFTETKESRRNMGLSLANLPEPLATADSLRTLCVHNHRAQSVQQHLEPADYGMAGDHHLIPQANFNNVSTASEHHQHRPLINNNQDHRGGNGSSGSNANQRQRKLHGYAATHSRRSSLASGGGEKRLIMLDVDPCCPRHGLVATTNSDKGN